MKYKQTYIENPIEDWLKELRPSYFYGECNKVNSNIDKLLLLDLKNPLYRMLERRLFYQLRHYEI